MRMTLALVTVMAASLLPSVGSAAQFPSPPGAVTAVINGRVVADETGEPVPNARVSVTPGGLEAQVVLADRDGQFTLAAPAGPYRVAASKSGYALAEAPPPAPGTRVELRLHRGAVLSGRVVDEFGEAVSLFPVMVEAITDPPSGRPIATAQTNDRGEFRIAGLRPGTVAVAAVDVRASVDVFTGQGRPAPPKRTYYPHASTLADAERIVLQFGEEHDGIDLVVSAEQPALPPVQQLRLQSGQLVLARGTSTVRGRVVAASGQAVAHALVRLMPGADFLQTRAMLADNNGQFVFSELPAGSFRIGASKRGFFATPGGAQNAEQVVEVGEGATRDDVTLRLSPGGSISGRVVDELDSPLEGVSVQLLQVRYERGRNRLVPSGTARLTDDRGRYRIHGLPPGQYVVSGAVGAVGSSELPGYAQSYFPNTSNPAQAQFAALRESQELAGIDLAMSRAPTARISGQLLNAAGAPTTGGSLTLEPSQSAAAVTSVPLGARIIDDGRFEFTGVPSGQYVIRADRGRSNAWTEGEFGVLPVAVDGADVTGLTLQTSAGSSIVGRIRFDAFENGAVPMFSGVSLSPVPVDEDLSTGNPAEANIHADGTFEIRGVTGLRRLQLTRQPEGWTLQELRVNGVDATDRILSLGRAEQSLSDVEVVLTDRVNVLGGSVRDEQGPVATTAAVIVFSTARDRWYPRSRFLQRAAAGKDGTFSMAGLPAGTYYVAAVAPSPSDGDEAWRDPAFLTSLIPRASTATLGDGDTRTLNLRLGGR
jgi:protocatechuate 3,4-dioxygenase beta subunit